MRRIKVVVEIGYPLSEVLYEGDDMEYVYEVETHHLYDELKTGGYTGMEDDMDEIGDTLREAYMKQVNRALELILKEVSCMSKDFLDNFNPGMITGFLESMRKVECCCDAYNGFDCGCGKRAYLIEEAIRGIDFLKKEYLT